MSEQVPSELSTTGERIRWMREKRGMSRTALAALVGRGPDWLKKIERGERELRSYTLLIRLASVLRIDDLAVLTGEQSVPVPATSRPTLDYVAEIRAAVRGPLFDRPTSAPVSLAVLRDRVAAGWRLWHSSKLQRSAIGDYLPGLLRDAQALVRSAEGAERRRAYATLADVYHLTQQATAYAVEPELYWIIADRGRLAAQEADDIVSLAGAAWAYANGLRETGYADEAIRVVEDAADALRPQLDDGSDDLRGMYGALRLHAAITYARNARSGDAWRSWDDADRIASRLPAGYSHTWTVFGRGNTDFHALSLGVDLRTPGVALERASLIDLDSVASVERRSRILVELGRAHMQRKDLAGTVYYMNRAVTVSPETVKYTPSARSLTVDLARQAAGPLKADALGLAEKVGILV